MVVIATTLVLAPGCAFDASDDDLAALEEQPTPDEGVELGDVELGDVGPAYHAGAGSTSNWWLPGDMRGPEQGTGGNIGPGDCPAGSAVIGVQYFEGGNSDWVDGIGVACWGPNLPSAGGYVWLNWYGGGPRDSEQGTHGVGMGLCPWGRAVTGVQYFDSDADWVDGLGVKCESPRSVYNWFPDHIFQSNEQGNRLPAGLECPAGLVVVGLQYFEGVSGNSDAIDGIGVHCGPRPDNWPTP